MPDNQVEYTVSARLTKEQKIGFFLLLIFSLVSIALGFLQIRNRFYAPFALSTKAPVTLKEEINGIDALRFRDTDQDGLNDFDELYINYTSPYLADTDSDGLNDKEELEKGTDPLCPAGKLCSVESDVEVTTRTPALEAPVPPTFDQAAIDVSKFLSNPDKVRQLLVEKGAKKEVLDKISDKELMALVSQMIMSTSTLDVTLPNSGIRF